MKTLHLIIGFPKCATSQLLYSFRPFMHDIGKTSANGEIQDNILDIIPTLNNMKEDFFVCKQPTFIYRPKILLKIKELCYDYKIDYKIIILIRNFHKQLYSFYNMRKRENIFNGTLKDFLSEKYICYFSHNYPLSISNLESLDFQKYITECLNIFDMKKIYIICQESLFNSVPQNIISFINMEKYVDDTYYIIKRRSNILISEDTKNIDTYNYIYNLYNNKYTDLIDFIKKTNINFFRS